MKTCSRLCSRVSLAILCLLGLWTAPATAGQALDLLLLHINDHHAHLLPETFAHDVSGLGLAAPPEGGTVQVPYGGFPALTTLVNDLASQAAAEGTPVLKLHAGDASTGTLFSTLFKGQADAALMNQICFDAFVLGNHEFDTGDAGLALFLDALAEGECGTPVLGANVLPGPESPVKGRVAPYVILERGGQQLAVVGILVADKTRRSSRPDPGTQFLDEYETAQRTIDALSAQGLDKIILLTHYGYANDLQLAARLRGVDVIVGGDSHTLLGRPELADLGLAPGGPYPTLARNADGDTVCVVQAWEYGHLLGALQVRFDAEGRVQGCAGSPVLPLLAGPFTHVRDKQEQVLDEADAELVRRSLAELPEVRFVAPDPAAQATLDGFAAEVEQRKATVIGQVGEKLCLARIPGDTRGAPLCTPEETARHGSDIAGLVAKAFLRAEPTADVAIQNGGGVRANVPPGPFTIADAYTLLPFRNSMVVLTMSGAELLAVLEDSLANFMDLGGSSGSYPYAAGLRFSVDLTQPRGARIGQVEVNSGLKGEWGALEPAATYRVVTSDFLAAGQDGYTTFEAVQADGRALPTYTEYAQAFVDYVSALTAAGHSLEKLPPDEYSTREFVGAAKGE